MATFQLGSSVILLCLGTFWRYDILDQIDVKIPIRQLSNTFGTLNSAQQWKQYQQVWRSDSPAEEEILDTETHPEGELDVVVVVSEHWLRSPVGDPALARTNVQTAEVPVATVTTLVVDISQHWSLSLTVPHPGQADPAGQQGVRRGSAEDKLGRTGNIEGQFWSGCAVNRIPGHFYTNQD